MRIGAILLALQILAFACKAGDNRTGTATEAVGTTPPGETDDPTAPADPGGSGVAEGLEFGALATTELFTSETAAGSCVNFTVTATSAAGPVADVGIVLTVQVSSGTMEDRGSISINSAVTNENGVLESSYCAGKEEGTVTIIAKAGLLSANSAKITVAKKALYQFAFSHADVAIGEEKALFLNTFDSGPQDCTTVYFKLMKSEAPVVGETITFKTQVDYPKGSKLAKRADAVTTAVDEKTGKKYATYDAISSGAGEFGVPVCAGVTLGTLLVSGSWVDDVEGKTYTAQSPVIRITSGITNYINMSLTFDPKNGRTLKGYYNTNSNYELPFEIQLGARFDGRAIIDYPVSLATEVGRYHLDNNGVADPVKGAVKASLSGLHLVDNYPYFVKTFPGFPGAQTRCDPEEIADYATAQSLTEYPYTDLAKNWRSTLVYSVRGQEHYHDANRNGIYDSGGDGFWDKNQNGIFDGADVLTFDAGNDSQFNPLSEWFIDLPTPFVDVDENGTFTATVDFLVGDEYSEPNGQRDSDTLLWKSEYFPISMGPSSYGLLHSKINAANFQQEELSVTVGGVAFPVWGADNSIDATVLWGGAVDDSAADYDFAIFAHDLCGSLLAGGTTVSMTFETISAPEWGKRDPAAFFPIQPGDDLLEPTRQLLLDGGKSSAKINFNAIDHPSKSLSYPLIGNIEVPACASFCTGDTQVNPGISCDGYSGYAMLSVQEPGLDQTGGSGVTMRLPVFFGAYEDCNCATNATSSKGVCKCTNPSEHSNGVACVP